jgi:hypothetical protein
MAEPHTAPTFTNAVTHTVAVTFTVAGGARHGTADRRARAIAERVTGYTARAAGVVEVSAVAGPSADGEIVSRRRVNFREANTGSGTYADPGKLDRYLDPDHELALRSLAAANAAYRERQAAERERRGAVGCRNSYSLAAASPCACVYCDPESHYAAVLEFRSSGHCPFVEYRCLCGTPVHALGQRCGMHRDRTIVVLDGDGSALQLLARHEQERQE